MRWLGSQAHAHYPNDPTCALNMSSDVLDYASSERESQERYIGKGGKERERERERVEEVKQSVELSNFEYSLKRIFNLHPMQVRPCCLDIFDIPQKLHSLLQRLYG